MQANVTMFADMEADGGTVTLRLPVASARQLGLAPPDWKKDTRDRRSSATDGEEKQHA